jgi:hypothetical protein
MTEVPASIPLTNPLDEPIVATAVVPLTHVPPEGMPVKVPDVPIHIDSDPVIMGVGFTVTTAVVVQPAGVYENVIVAVSAVIPVTMPVVAPTTATVVLLLLHVPPDVASLSVVVAPTHKVRTPVIAAGGGLTVIV